MFWKTVVLAFFFVGVFGNEYEFTEDRKRQLNQTVSMQCEKVNAGNHTDEVIVAAHAFVDCIRGIFTYEVLKQEIEDAKPKGALDEVFKKYCAKTPELKTCLHTLGDAFKPCLDDGTKVLLPSAKNGTDQLIDFVCHKDGDRIALFISEKGPECIAEKVNGIRDCFTNNIKGVLTSDGAVSTPINLTLRERCTKYDDLSGCVVQALESCDTPTPGNMAESLFRYVRKGSPCNAELPKEN